jgi:SAM-dependent methyltransferase
VARIEPGSRCYLCHSPNVKPVPFTTAPPYSEWVRCTSCGSDTAKRVYDPLWYGDDFSLAATAHAGGVEACRDAVKGNAAWFIKHAGKLPRTFLDVGCGDGAMLMVMHQHGWSVHGWDVCVPHYDGPHITTSPVFHRWLFPMRYGFVNCREVIEHCPWPDLLLNEIREVCEPGGLVQVQTPVPVDTFDGGVYSVGHLFVASVDRMKLMLKNAGLTVLDELHWGGDRQAGQAYICRR